MSMFREEHGEPYVPVYDNGRTKQSFKDETDINMILARAQQTGVISHMAKHQPTYGDFADFDFLEAQMFLAKGKEIFADLPSEVRREFEQSPSKFFAFVNDPDNVDKLHEVLPGLAAPGKQLPDVEGQVEPDEGDESPE